MNISRAAFDKLNTLISGEPPETGGILGSKKNNTITDIILDRTQKSFGISCYYEPDVDFLNKCIDEWAGNGILFKGVFHTHFAGVKTLSSADKKYISSIMKNMPEEIVYLYFPVFVLPNRELVCYKAERADSEVSIYLEDVIII